MLAKIYMIRTGLKIPEINITIMMWELNDVGGNELLDALETNDKSAKKKRKVLRTEKKGRSIYVCVAQQIVFSFRSKDKQALKRGLKNVKTHTSLSPENEYTKTMYMADQ